MAANSQSLFFSEDNENHAESHETRQQTTSFQTSSDTRYETHFETRNETSNGAQDGTQYELQNETQNGTRSESHFETRNERQYGTQSESRFETRNDETQYGTRHDEEAAASEHTPLLPRAQSHADQSQPQRERSAEDLLQSIQQDGSGGNNGGNGDEDGDDGDGGNGKPTRRRRWPSLLALLLLCLVAVLIMVFAFFAPSVVEEYAAEAAIFEPSSLSVESFTDTGVRARIQANFWMDADRVGSSHIRNLGRIGTWFAREVESGESAVVVSLPEYGNVVLGRARVPPVKVDVRNGHTTHVDFVCELQPGNTAGIRRIARDWIDGRLAELRVLGRASIPLKSGIFSFGTQTVTHELSFTGDDIPAIPHYDLQSLNFHEFKRGGMQADASLLVENHFPVDFSAPSLGFQALVQGCEETDPYIKVADASTAKVHIRPKEDVEVNVTGIVRKLPNLLTQDCPGVDESPLDTFLGNYMRGKENIVYVKGAPSPAGDTPEWLDELISDIVVPVPLPGRTMGHLIKNFTLADTQFLLPDPFADPSRDEAKPRISAKVQALIAVPKEMNFNVSANRVRADAEVFHKGKKFGTLDLHKWQAANSTRLEDTTEEGAGLLVESLIKRAPLDITDEQVFADIIQDLIFSGKTVIMQIKANVDVQVATALGEFKVRRIPAEGKVPVKPIPRGGGGSSFSPKISDLQIIDTTSSSLTLTALVNLTNPTKYAASVPYVDIQLLKNGSLLGHATARDLYIAPGENPNLLVTAVYDPLTLGGPKAKSVGKELISQYLSGWNTSISLRTHRGTFPNQPNLGEALSRFVLEIQTPKLGASPPSDPSDPDSKPQNGTHFIKDATMHLISSTATFTLLSPLRHSTLYVETINATALYKGEDVGRIEYELPFAVPPVDKDGNGITTPHLPVEWSLGSVGYEAVKKALGGTLKLAAVADVGVRIGKFRETIWFQGKGIGAHVTF